MRFNRNFRGRGIENLRPKNLRKALDLIFNTNPLDPRITFTRATSRTRINEAGTLVRVPFNMLTYSEQFDNAAWAKTIYTVSANATTAPDGTLTADFIDEATTASADRKIAASPVTITASAVYTGSIYLKQGTGRTSAQVRLASGNGTFSVFGTQVDLVTGTLSGGGLGGGMVSGSATITAAANGFYRVSVTGVFAADVTAAGVTVYGWNGSTTAYVGVPGNGIYIWGAHLNPGTVADDYYPTTTAANGAPAIDYDPVTLACRGLSIWEARTNLLTYSQQFDNAAHTLVANVTVLPNDTTAPDGTVTADRITKTANAFAVIGQAVTGAAGNYAGTVFAKDGNLGKVTIALFDGTPAAIARGVYNFSTGLFTAQIGSASDFSVIVGNSGWVQIAAIKNATVANPQIRIYPGDATEAIAGYVYLWQADLQAGSSVGPCIPTTTAQVTRAADVAVISGANFSNFYNQTEGTFVIEWNTPSTAADAAGRVIFGTADGTFTNTAYIAKRGSTMLLDPILNSGGVNQLTSMAALTLAASGSAKDAFSYKANDAAVSHDGAAVVTDATVTVAPGQNILGLGTAPWGPGGNVINGHIRSITYYPTRLTNAQLVTLSTP